MTTNMKKKQAGAELSQAGLNLYQIKFKQIELTLTMVLTCVTWVVDKWRFDILLCYYCLAGLEAENSWIDFKDFY